MQLEKNKDIETFRNLILNIKSFENDPKESQFFQGWNLCWHVFRLEFNDQFPEYKILLSECK